MAEENKKFFGTPDRFRKKPRSSSLDAFRGRKRSPSPSAVVRRAAVYATVPQSPMLLTRGRSRCHQETEKEEVIRYSR